MTRFQVRCAILFSFVALLLSAMSPCRAQAGGSEATAGFATIDYRTCIALHPLIADFDFAAGRFSKPGIKRNDHMAMEALYKSMTQKRKALEPRRLDLERKRSALQLQSNNLDLGQIQDVVIPVKDVSRSSQSAALSGAALEARRRDLWERIAALDLEIDKLNDGIWDDLFLTKEETDRRLAQIVAEVDAAIRETAARYRVEAVIDDTLQAASLPVDLMQNVPESTPLWTNSVFKIALDSPFPTPGKPSMANHWAGELQRNLERQIVSYLGQRQDISPLVHGFRAPRLFVMGGVDLTSPVCERIFARYQLNPYLIQALRAGIASFRK